VWRLPDDAAAALSALDLVLGAVAVTSHAARATVHTLRLTPLVAWGARPFLHAGRTVRERVVREVDAVLPLVVNAAVRRYVDLDGLVATVDLDAVAERLDVEAVVARVDLDAVVARVDLDAVVARVDLDAVAARIDVEAILDRLDLTGTVLTRVDLKVVVDQVLAQVDLPVLVEGVLDEIDLPEIIRDSTGTMASETVQGVRMQGVNADEAVTRVVDRLLLRHRSEPGAAR
jgi:hypothetical protein